MEISLVCYMASSMGMKSHLPVQGDAGIMVEVTTTAFFLAPKP